MELNLDRMEEVVEEYCDNKMVQEILAISECSTEAKSLSLMFLGTLKATVESQYPPDKHDEIFRDSLFLITTLNSVLN